MTARDPVSSGEAMIEANGLAKYYGDFIAIEDVSFRVPRGEIVAFLGPNGGSPVPSGSATCRRMGRSIPT